MGKFSELVVFWVDLRKQLEDDIGRKDQRQMLRLFRMSLHALRKPQSAKQQHHIEYARELQKPLEIFQDKMQT